MRRLFIAIVLLVAISGLALWLLLRAHGEDPQALLSMKKSQHAEALRASAQRGDEKAMVLLGDAYLNGDGVSKAPDKAMDWYKKAADKGDVQAAYDMAVLYERGLGVAQDYYAAAKWYRLAATFGKNVPAQFALGRLYFTGRGVENDFGKALKYYRMAAARGHAGAQYLLGAMYEEGWGLKVDLVQAYYWYSLAAHHADQAMAINPKYDPRPALKRIRVEMSKYQIGVGEKMLRDQASSAQ